MKKLLIVLIAFMTVFTLIGCGGETTAATTAAATTVAPTTTETPGDVLRIYQNKVEIGAALTAYAEAWGETNGVEVEVVTCGGDSCAYGTQILAEFQTAKQPDIFVIEGMGGYNEYSDYVLDLTGQAWLLDTDLAFTVDGTPYGFPVAVEGWGMAYNLEILEAAGVDPDDLTTQAAYTTAFNAIEAYYLATYGANWDDDYAVVSMAAGAGMTWVTGLHNFNGYLSSGLAYDDSSVIDDLNDGIANVPRLTAYADWVELLYNFSDPTILLEGTYDTQVEKFASGHAAFIHQGNWIDPNLMAYFNAETDPYPQFEMGYAPHAAAAGENTSIFVSAPSYYVINTNSDVKVLAKQFLNDLASTTEGHEYMVNEAGMIPAFKSVTLAPSNPLSAAVAEWMASGNIYAWWQNDMPSGFGMDTLGPIYTNFASGTLSKANFILAVQDEIEALG